jgi:amino acid adenylation domain-containing protein
MTTTAEGALEIAAQILNMDAATLAGRSGSDSFVALGGTSLDALRLLALAERRLGLRFPLAAVLGGAPLTEVIRAAVPVTVPSPPASVRDGSSYQEILPAQDGMLVADWYTGESLLHLLSSAELSGPLDIPALREAVSRLVAGHESLRTTFARIDRRLVGRVLPTWRPALTEQRVRVAAGDDPVEVVHAQLSRTTRQMLAPMRRPPINFVLTVLDPDRHLLSIIIHHVITDAWSMGIIWRDLLNHYREVRAGLPASGRPGSTIAPAVRQLAGLSVDRRLHAATAARVEQLRGAPTELELPTDLPRARTFDYRGARHSFGLGDSARAATEQLAEAARVTRTTVLLAAFALTIARYTGQTDFLLGASVMVRTTGELLDAVGPLAPTVPVRCRVADNASVEEYLRDTARELADGVAAADVPLSGLISGLGAQQDGRRMPLVQILFTAQDEFMPDRLTADGLTAVIHEGHCGGATADAVLTVQRWGDEPRLTLDYATCALTAADAADLAAALEATLVDLGTHLGRPLAGVRGMTEHDRETLAAWRDGPESPVGPGLWEVLCERAQEHRDAPAVVDPAHDITLTYAQLIAAAERQAAALARAGVTAGSVVAVMLPRSAAEIVTLAAVARLGAAFTAPHPDNPPSRLAAMLRLSRPRAVVAEAGRAAELARLAGNPCAVVAPVDLAAADGLPGPTAPPLPPADPERIAYIAFTSGSTGGPKAVRVAQRGVLRLLNDGMVAVRPQDRFLRFVTLAFDIAVLEIFRPLAAGAAVVVCPESVLAPADLAAFLAAQQVSIIQFSAGLFRVLAEDCPEAFAGARHVLVGGDVVPADLVRGLLERYSGLAVSNVYGPTENTVWTTRLTVTDPCEVGDTLPIGRPLPGNSVEILDYAGRPVPPGGIGELYLSGPGLCVDYLDNPDATAAALGVAADGRRRYRTGDLVRWDRQGRLCFLGRNDQQVKVRGFRIETEEIRRRLLEHRAVRDAVVATVGTGAAERRLVAAVVTGGDPVPVAELRAFVAEQLPAYAVPTLWAVLDQLPLNSNGKPDLSAVHRAACDVPSGPDPEHALAGSPGGA